jgi:hypothetical protein
MTHRAESGEASVPYIGGSVGGLLVSLRGFDFGYCIDERYLRAGLL